MKNKLPSSGFEMNMLPPTRKLQFKDQMKLNYFLYLKIGFLLLLFALPLIACFLGERLVILYYSNDAIIEKGGLIVYELLLDLGKIIGLALLGVGLAGCLRIYRRCAWNEPILFGLDFKEGVKNNFRNILFVSLFTGLYFLVINLMLNMGLYIVKNGTILIVLYFLLISLYAFVLLPVFILMIASSVYYSNNLMNDLKNSFILSVKNYLPYILIVLLTIAPYFISFINNMAIQLAVAASYFVLICPIYLLITNLYLLNIFDKYINVNYKEYLYKGLYRKETSHEEN